MDVGGRWAAGNGEAKMSERKGRRESPSSPVRGQQTGVETFRWWGAAMSLRGPRAEFSATLREELVGLGLSEGSDSRCRWVRVGQHIMRGRITSSMS